MDDKKIIARQMKFFSSNNESSSQEKSSIFKSEDKKIRKRKEKLETKFYYQRIYSIDKEPGYQILLDELEIPNEIQKNFELLEFSEKLKIINDQYLSIKADKNIMKYAVLFLRQYTTHELSNIQLSMEFESFRSIFCKLLEILIKIKEKKLIYEITWIIINLTYHSNDFSKILVSEDYLPQFYNLFKEFEDPPIIHHITNIFSNILIAENHDLIKCFFRICPDYKDRLLTIYILNQNSIDFTIVITWCVSNLFKLNIYGETEFRLILNRLIENILKANNFENSEKEVLFKESIDLFKKNTDLKIEQDFILNNFLQKNVLDLFISCLGNSQVNFNTKSSLIQFLAKLILIIDESGELDRFLKKIIISTEKLVNYCYHNRYKNDDDIVKMYSEIIFITQTICNRNQILCDLVCESKIIEVLFILGLELNDDIKIETLELIEIILQNCSRSSMLRLIKQNIISYLINNLKDEEKSDDIMICLNCLKILLEFGESLNIMNNIVKCDIDNHEIKLYKLEQHKNQQISEKIMNLRSIYWEENSQMMIEL